MDSRNSLSNLLSPPEPTPYDNFDDHTMSSGKPMFPKAMSMVQILSPPVSPQTKLSKLDHPSTGVRDPILFPSDNNRAQSPLFQEEDSEALRVVDEHIRKLELRKEAHPPRDDYVLALEFKSQVMKLFNRDQEAWRRREMKYLREDDLARKMKKNALAKLAPKPSPKMSQKPVFKTPTKPKQRAPRPPRDNAAPRQRIYSATPEPGRQRQSTTTTREDKEFNLLPDYSPPINTLPNRPNSLKVEWKGAPIDLSEDPCVHLLHPDEVALAANLRLDCATYLTSKRRIFIARIECLKRGKEFRKTDSQQACKIDVNKASKLWSAFEKVGWLKAEYFRQFV